MKRYLGQSGNGFLLRFAGGYIEVDIGYVPTGRQEGKDIRKLLKHIKELLSERLSMLHVLQSLQTLRQYDKKTDIISLTFSPDLALVKFDNTLGD